MSVEMSTEDRDSLDALLDEIEHLSDRNEDQRAVSVGCHVYLNIYDMVLEQNCS